MTFRFQFHKIGFTTDVAKIYQHIKLSKPARDVHRILWRNGPNMPLEHWRMTRVTNGIATRAHHSVRVFKEIAKDTTDNNVKWTIIMDVYTDDLLLDANAQVKAKQMQDELKKALRKV